MDDVSMGHAPGGGGEVSNAVEQGPPAWVDELSQSFSNQLAEMGQRIEGRLPEGRFEPDGYGDEHGFEGDDDDFDFEDDDPGVFGDHYFDGDDPEDAAFERMLGGLADPGQEREELLGEVDRRVAERLAPFEQEQRDEQFAALAEEYPELATEEGATALVDLAAAAARRLGAPQFASSPLFAKLVFLAKKGEERAAGEQPVPDAKEVQLEGGGATPGEPEREHPFIEMAKRGNRNTISWD
jgi:hypothetical protein